MRKGVKKEIVITVAIAIFFLVFLSPIVIALSGSFRELKDTSSYLNIFQSFSLESYRTAFEKMNYFRSLKNSVLITAISVTILLLVGSMAGYALNRIIHGRSIPAKPCSIEFSTIGWSMNFKTFVSSNPFSIFFSKNI